MMLNIPRDLYCAHQRNFWVGLFSMRVSLQGFLYYRVRIFKSMLGAQSLSLPVALPITLFYIHR